MITWLKSLFGVAHVDRKPGPSAVRAVILKASGEAKIITIPALVSYFRMPDYLWRARKEGEVPELDNCRIFKLKAADHGFALYVEDPISFKDLEE